MIVCTQCGDRSEDGADFCASCGSFLEYSGQRVVGDAEGATTPSPTEAHHTLADRVKSAVHRELSGAADETPVVAVSRSSSTEAAPARAEQPAAPIVGSPPLPPQTTTPPPPAAPSSPLTPDRAERAPTPPLPQAADTLSLTGKAVPAPPPATTAGSAPAPPSTLADAGATAPTAPVRPGSAPAARAPSTPPSAAVPVSPASIGVRPGAVPTEPAPAPSAQPAAVRPDAQRSRAAARPVVAAPPPVARADDIVCSACGEPSARGRRFCRRCGASLVATPAAVTETVKVPWYRRLLIRLHLARPASGAASREPEEPSAERRGFWRRTADRLHARRVMVAVVAVAVVVLALTPVRTVVADGVSRATGALHRAILPSWEEVYAKSATASVEIPGHPAKLAIDKFKNTYWAAPAPAPTGPPLTLRVFFDQPVSFGRIGITAGLWENPRLSLAEAQPRHMRVILPDGHRTEFDLRDSPQFQAFEIDARDVRSVDIQIATVRAGQEGNLVNLAVVEFFENR